MKTPKPRSQFGVNLLRVQDEDRRSIANELHSTTSQRLAALQLNLALVGKSADQLDPRARAALADSIDLVRTCAREIRSVSYRLHPPLLDEFGLSAALRTFADEYTQRTGMRFDMALPPELARLRRDVELGIFRIIQESSENLHPAGATRLDLRYESSTVSLEIVYPAPKGPPDSVVLAAIRERARQLRGRLTIRSSGSALTLRLKISTR